MCFTDFSSSRIKAKPTFSKTSIRVSLWRWSSLRTVKNGTQRLSTFSVNWSINYVALGNWSRSKQLRNEERNRHSDRCRRIACFLFPVRLLFLFRIYKVYTENEEPYETTRYKLLSKRKGTERERDQGHHLINTEWIRKVNRDDCLVQAIPPCDEFVRGDLTVDGNEGDFHIERALSGIDARFWNRLVRRRSDPFDWHFYSRNLEWAHRLQWRRQIVGLTSANDNEDTQARWTRCWSDAIDEYEGEIRTVVRNSDGRTGRERCFVDTWEGVVSNDRRRHSSVEKRGVESRNGR